MRSLRVWVSTEKKAGLRIASSDTPTFKLESGRWWRTSKQEWEEQKVKGKPKEHGTCRSREWSPVSNNTESQVWEGQRTDHSIDLKATHDHLQFWWRGEFWKEWIQERPGGNEL